MKIKKSLGEHIFNVFNFIFMVFMMLITLYPMLYVVFASFSDSRLFEMHDGLLFAPLGFSVESYIRVFQNPMIITGYINTIWVLIVGLICSMFVSTVTAYVLSRRNFPAGKYMSLFIIFTMYFGGGMVPVFLTVKAVGLYDSMWALIIPSVMSAYNMIILRTSFNSIPVSLEESASLDGAGHLTILFKIVLPLSKATLAVIALYYAVSYWNKWFDAMIYLADREKYPLQLVMKEILIQNDTSSMTTELSDTGRASVAETIKYAVVIVATVPILMAYPFLQRYFVKGVMIGAVKG